MYLEIEKFLSPWTSLTDFAPRCSRNAKLRKPADAVNPDFAQTKSPILSSDIKKEIPSTSTKYFYTDQFHLFHFHVLDVLLQRSDFHIQLLVLQDNLLRLCQELGRCIGGYTELQYRRFISIASF